MKEYTEYAFKLGAMSLDDLYEEAELKCVEVDEDLTAEALRSLLLSSII